MNINMFIIMIMNTDKDTNTDTESDTDTDTARDWDKDIDTVRDSDMNRDRDMDRKRDGDGERDRNRDSQGQDRDMGRARDTYRNTNIDMDINPAEMNADGSDTPRIFVSRGRELASSFEKRCFFKIRKSPQIRNFPRIIPRKTAPFRDIVLGKFWLSLDYTAKRRAFPRYRIIRGKNSDFPQIIRVKFLQIIRVVSSFS
jgi:hypothetical protein